jgi:hypothetical protein
MPYFARFTIHEGYRFRLDTRIYLRESDAPSKCDQCVAAVVAKNPGSACPTELDRLSRLSLAGDKLLPNVRNRFRTAYRLSSIEVPHGAFVRVWNLVYLCNPNLSEAIVSFRTIRQPLFCNSENTIPRIVWFAWGPPNSQLQHFTQRFRNRTFKQPFYFDMDIKKIVPRIPTTTSRVKHTQGLPCDAVEKHLAQIIGK